LRFWLYECRKTIRLGAFAASLFAIIKAMAAAVQTSPRIRRQYLFTLTSKEVSGAR
jgi:hypothetical protein